MKAEIQEYNNQLPAAEKAVCDLLAEAINAALPEEESKIWHGHPVWFLSGNPIAGYSQQKAGIRLMFWSGAGFNDEKLQPGTGKFKDASVFYTAPEQVNAADLQTWLEQARNIQWDYKNLAKRKGKLEKIAL